MDQKNYIFKKTHELDKEEFAKLLQAAKGERRSMRAFARECGADPSTFTRIVQKTNKGSSSLALIEAIAKYADPDSDVTIEKLAQASGYTVTESTRFRDPRVFLMKRQNNIRTTRTVIADELLDRNKEFRLLPSGYGISHFSVRAPDVIILTDAFGEQNELWILDIKNAVGVDIHSEDQQMGWLDSVELFDLLGRYLMIDRTKTDKHQTYRYSLVVFNRNVFATAIAMFGHIQLPITFSFLLIDPAAGVIVDEFFLPHETEGQQNSFFLPERAQGL